MADLAPVEKLIAEATPGPWDLWDVVFVRMPSTQRPDYEDQVYGFEPTHDREQAIPDASFIAHARQLLPLMLEVVKSQVDFSDCGREECARCTALRMLDAYISEHLPAPELTEGGTAGDGVEEEHG